MASLALSIGLICSLKRAEEVVVPRCPSGPITTFTPPANPYTGLASCVSLNTAVAVRVGKHRVTYQPSPGSEGKADRMQLRIDGTLVKLSASPLNLGGGNMVAMASSGGGLGRISSGGCFADATALCRGASRSGSTGG